jgi:hypothetical protein
MLGDARRSARRVAETTRDVAKKLHTTQEQSQYDGDQVTPKEPHPNLFSVHAPACGRLAALLPAPGGRAAAARFMGTEGV